MVGGGIERYRLFREALIEGAEITKLKVNFT
jgi:hypothetical protein